MSISKAAIRRLVKRYQLAIVSAGNKRAALGDGADAVPAETQRVLCAVVKDLQEVIQ